MGGRGLARLGPHWSPIVPTNSKLCSKRPKCDMVRFTVHCILRQDAYRIRVFDASTGLKTQGRPKAPPATQKASQKSSGDNNKEIRGIL